MNFFQNALERIFYFKIWPGEIKVETIYKETCALHNDFICSVF